MDPAGLIPGQEMEASQIHHALSHQGALVGQHSQALQQLMTSMQELTSSVAQTGSQLAQVSSLMVPPAAQPNPLSAPLEPPVPQSREPRVPAPDRYSGELGLCRAFLIQCSLVFEQQPLSYPTDRSKIAYLMSLLKGNALAWASAVWDNQSPISQSFICFTTEMGRVLVIRLDSRLRERKRERASRAPSTSSSRFSSPPNVSLQSPLVSPFTSSNTTSHRPTEEPMHLGRARLSPAERTRRMQAGVCLYYGQNGHYITSCPVRPKEQARQ
ncbi:hypothetical protein DPEC_G00225840 [Dallia pectoralis]|uniref:Uncharacterized protein n=1 Tax=Dallia pectoralis TaxID=75939 RepID=A0ACC2G0I9_DALPE|nr:hypothetical protein DPEC_G00225840 [Dallia pectoralis]